MKLKRILHKALVGVGVMILAVSILGAKEALAVCDISAPSAKVYGPPLPTSWCHSYVDGDGQGIQTNCGTAYAPTPGSGTWSATQAVYSCGSDDEGDYCYCHVEACDTACDGGGGGGGYRPAWAGYHDAYFGVQESAACRAVGWVTDLNRPDRDVPIHIYSDGAEIYTGSASLYRDGLASYCIGGTCAFDVDLNGLISYGVDHNILIQVGVAHVLPDSGSPPRGFLDRKINCVEPPPANTAPTGTLTCPGSPMFLGQIASFTLHGSDVDGNLSYAGLYYSPINNQSWNTINANIACTGGSCSPPTQSWTPIDT